MKIIFKPNQMDVGIKDGFRFHVACSSFLFGSSPLGSFLFCFHTIHTDSFGHIQDHSNRLCTLRLICTSTINLFQPVLPSRRHRLPRDCRLSRPQLNAFFNVLSTTQSIKKDQYHHVHQSALNYLMKYDYSVTSAAIVNITSSNA